MAEDNEEYWRDNAKELIEKYSLQNYEDVIMENLPHNTNNLLTIADYVWDDTEDIERVCEIYSQLGYPGYDHRMGNERYLILLIQNWDTFYYEKIVPYSDRLNDFYRIDHEEKAKSKKSIPKGIASAIPTNRFRTI